jgi:hypothetical protein
MNLLKTIWTWIQTPTGHAVAGIVLVALAGIAVRLGYLTEGQAAAILGLLGYASVKRGQAKQIAAAKFSEHVYKAILDAAVRMKPPKPDTSGGVHCGGTHAKTG